MQSQEVLTTMNSRGIIGKSQKLMEAVEAAIRVAPYDVPVLVTGENGVGKEVFHKILHEGSRRRHAKCLAINCGGLPEDTITSELFGHVKGAFTGSVSDRKGYFEEADGGTLFLDEVGDLPLNVQAKLLRVLETGEILRMGSSEVKKVDVRIVAATNVDLQKAIERGRFREDLYYRLSTIQIHVPALRERPEDILLLFRYFSGRVANKYRLTQGIQLSEEARATLLAYSWPGNIRQLSHLVEQMSIVEMERIISDETLRRYLPAFDSGVRTTGSAEGNAAGMDGNNELFNKYIVDALMNMRRELDEVRAKLGLSTHTGAHNAAPRALPAAPTPAADLDIEEALAEEIAEEVTPTPNASPAPAPRTMEQIEREAIKNALQRHGGNKQKAADELQISARTIHRKIQEYGLDDKV